MDKIPLRALRPEWNHAARILLSVLCASERGAVRRWPAEWFQGGNYAIPLSDAIGRRLAESLYVSAHAAIGGTPFNPDARPSVHDLELAERVVRLCGTAEALRELDGAEVTPVAGPRIRLRPSQIRSVRPAHPGDPAGTGCVVSYTGTPEAPSAHGEWTHLALCEPASAVLGRMGL